MIVVKAFNKRDIGRNSCTTWQWLHGRWKNFFQGAASVVKFHFTSTILRAKHSSLKGNIEV